MRSTACGLPEPCTAALTEREIHSTHAHDGAQSSMRLAGLDGRKATSRTLRVRLGDGLRHFGHSLRDQERQSRSTKSA